LVAVTVRIEELPAAIDMGFAVMLTVGGGFDAAFTVTVAAELTLPDDPVATAV